jgi:hypothetical protein
VDVPHGYLVPKDQRTEWRCANRANILKTDYTCPCKTIKLGDEVIEITEDVLGNIRFRVTTPNPKLADPVYTRSYRCAMEILKLFLHAHSAKPTLNMLKMAPDHIACCDCDGLASEDADCDCRCHTGKSVHRGPIC